MSPSPDLPSDRSHNLARKTCRKFFVWIVTGTSLGAEIAGQVLSSQSHFLCL